MRIAALAGSTCVVLCVVLISGPAFSQCSPSFNISGPDATGVITVTASASGGCFRTATFTRNGDGWVPFGANPSWGDGVPLQRPVFVGCDTPGTYTCVMTESCNHDENNSCTYPNPPATQQATYVVSPRKPFAKLKLDSANSRIEVDYGYGVQVGDMQLEIDHGGFARVNNGDCFHLQGTCYINIDMACTGQGSTSAHSYEVALNSCPQDLYEHSGPLIVPGTLCIDPPKDDTNCKPKEDDDPKCPDCASKCVGKPLDVASGDVSVSVPLFTIGQSPLPLSFDLSYHSLAPSYPLAVSSPISSGWSHTFSSTMRTADPVNLPNRLMLVTPRGMRYYFDKATSTKWLPVKPLGSRDWIDLVNGEYILRKPDGSETHYDSATGNWKKTRDRWGNAITGTYDTNGHLATITDSENRSITLAYTGASIASVTLPTGELWTLSYSNGNLTSITDPINTAPWRTFEYVSDSHGATRLLSAMRDAAGVLLEGHTYDSSDRGITSVSEGGRESLSVAYDTPSVGQTRVTEAIDSTTTRDMTFSVVAQKGEYYITALDGACSSCGGGSDHQAYTYDSAGQVATHVYSSGSSNSTTTSYTYDNFGNVLSKTEATGTALERTFNYEYTDKYWPTFNTRVSEQGATGNVKTTDYAWNDASETQLTTTETGHLPSGAVESLTTVLAFDTAHRLLSVDGSRTDVSDVTSYAYYGDTDADSSLRGRLHTVANALGHVTTLENYDVFGTARKSTDPNGIVTLRTTDARGRTTAVTNQAVSGDPNESNDYVSTYSFDTRDRLTETVSPRGLHTKYGYEDGTNRLTDTTLIDLDGYERDRHHVAYDLTGLKTLEQDQSCTSPALTCTSWSVKREETYKYDGNRRLIEVDHSGDKVLYGYDSDGMLTSVQDENHTSPNTTYSYDTLHRLTTVSQTLAGASNNAVATQYAYDAQDNLTSVTDPNGNATTYVYDDFHRLQTQTSPVTATTTYSYDPAGNLTSSTDANAATTTRVYDALNRVTSAVSAGSSSTETVTWTYDGTSPYALGRLMTMTDPTGSTTYSYDRRGLLRSEQRDLGGATYTTSYAYDNDANRTAITYPTGAMLTYTYDFADRPFSVVWPSLGVSIVSAAVYRPFGPLSTLVYGNGATRTITYDTRYRVTENLLTAYGGSTIADYTYSNDGAGNITAIHDATDTSYDRTFTYDDLNRLLTANTGSSLWQAGSYSYDAMGNILSRSLGMSPADDGQVLSRPGKRVSLFGVSGQVDQLFFNYQGTTPKLTNVRSTQLPANDGTVLSVPRRHGASTAATNELMHSVQYDAAGNETQYFVQRIYSPRNLLASVIDNSSDDGNHHIDYGYDGREVRVSRNEGPNPTGDAKRYYVYTPELQLLEITDDDTANVWSQRAHTFASPLPGNHLFVWFGGQPVAEWGPPRTADSVALSRHRPPVPLTATSLFLTFTDHLGTPLLQFTTSGDVVWRAEYEPYGNVWSMRKGSRLDQPLRFPGQDMSMTWEGGEENYNIFRWYRAGWGRYTQNDPMDALLPLAHYGYATENPIRFKDGLGLWCGSGKSEKYTPEFDWMLFDTLYLSDPCEHHDCCYESCGAVKNDCDWALYADIGKECAKINKLLYVNCKMVAWMYYTAVQELGQSAFDDAQKHCTMCQKKLPPQSPMWGGSGPPPPPPGWGSPPTLCKPNQWKGMGPK